MGANNASPGGRSTAGAVYVVYGQPPMLPTKLKATTTLTPTATLSKGMSMQSTIPPGTTSSLLSASSTTLTMTTPVMELTPSNKTSALATGTSITTTQRVSDVVTLPPSGTVFTTMPLTVTALASLSTSRPIIPIAVGVVVGGLSLSACLGANAQNEQTTYENLLNVKTNIEAVNKEGRCIKKIKSKSIDLQK